MFLRTTAIDKILELTKFVKGIQGGTSAGKTFGILPILIDDAAEYPLTETSVVAESIPHLKRGAIKDFKKIMVETKRWQDDRWNGTDFKYTFANQSVIEFFSADSDSKLRGARRDYLYMNECNNMTLHSYTELAARTKKGIYLDWNPVNEFWFHKELKGDHDVDFLTINYLDNEACPESALNFILKAKEKAKTSKHWENWYKVYGLGQIGTLQGTVFENWSIAPSIPKDAELIAYSLDWGYSNDPTALVACYKSGQQYYFDELIYQTKLTNSDIIDKLIKLGVSEYSDIIADSAEPKSIDEIKSYGVNIIGATKGQGSVSQGIQFVQDQRISMTKRSLNTIKCYRNYMFKTDKEGKILNDPDHQFSDPMDAIRYGLSNYKPSRVGPFKSSY